MSNTAPPQGAGRPPQQMPKGPPYLPQTAQLGGLPTVKVDVPICAVLLFLFVCGAVTNMTILQLNRRRSHKFVFSGLVFGFCMARIVALSMRIAWATHPTNVNVAIAANVFTQAGVLLLFILNLIFTQRMVRSYHPTFGWHRAVTYTFRALFACVVALLIMVVTVSVHMFFTLNPHARSMDRDVQLVAITFLATLAFLPIPICLAAVLIPARKGITADPFGTGHMRTKLALLLFTSTLLSLGAGFRTGVAFDVRPAAHPAWFHHRACYYCFNFVIELIVVFAYVASRFDRRFHVPDGSSAPGHYGAGRADREKDGIPTRLDTAGTGYVDGYGDGGSFDGGDNEAAWAERARKELDTPSELRPVQ